MDPMRPGLLALAAAPALQAGWMLTAPRGFYDTFPGASRAWLPPLGPYAEHLVRDIGAAQLGIAVVLVAAAVLRERTLVRVALLAFVAATLPHLAFHLTTTGSYTASDDVLSLGGFALQLALAAWLLTRATITPTLRSAPWPASRPSPPRRAVP